MKFLRVRTALATGSISRMVRLNRLVIGVVPGVVIHQGAEQIGAHAPTLAASRTSGAELGGLLLVGVQCDRRGLIRR